MLLHTPNSLLKLQIQVTKSWLEALDVGELTEEDVQLVEELGDLMSDAVNAWYDAQYEAETEDEEQEDPSQILLEPNSPFSE